MSIMMVSFRVGMGVGFFPPHVVFSSTTAGSVPTVTALIHIVVAGAKKKPAEERWRRCHVVIIYIVVIAIIGLIVVDIFLVVGFRRHVSAGTSILSSRGGIVVAVVLVGGAGTQESGKSHDPG